MEKNPKKTKKPTHKEQLGRRFRAKISLNFPHTRLRHMPFVCMSMNQVMPSDTETKPLS